MNFARLFLVLLLTGWSSLVFLHTDIFWLFPLTIGATEYGHWFGLLTLALAMLGNRQSPVGITTTLLAGLATLAFFWPTAQALVLARNVPQRIEAAFPSTLPTSLALSLPQLWLGSEVPAMEPRQTTYATHENEPLSLYFFPPKATRPAPCIILLHSGGWYSGTPREFEKMSRWLTTQGYAVAAIAYRFAPRHPWPAQRDDVLDAIAYLTKDAAQLQIDPTRFVLFGRSAGGQIAEAVAYGTPNPNIRGCIAFYAPADLHFAYRYARSDDILNSLKLVTDYLGGTPDTVGPNYDSASAILHVTPQTVPTLLIHGTPDRLVWVKQSQRLAAVLTKNKTPHLFLEFPWATHAFDYNFDGPGGQLSRYAVAHFLAHVTQRQDVAGAATRLAPSP